MRRAERRRLDERLVMRQQTGDRMDARHLERRLRVERREDAGQPPREHRLARARRPAEQQVVPAGCGDLERAPRALVPSHVREVGRRNRLRMARRCDLVRLELAPQIGDGIGEMPERQSLDAGERSLGRRLRRAQQPLDAHAPRALRDREHAADPAQPPVERELADSCMAVELRVRQLPRRREHRERDRQVVARAFLAQARRREVDGDAPAAGTSARRTGSRCAHADAPPRTRGPAARR